LIEVPAHPTSTTTYSVTEEKAMAQAILGIDVSKEKLDVALLQEDQCLHREIPNTPTGFDHLNHWLKNRKVSSIHACLEATGQYGNGVAKYLYQQGHLVSMVNPARIKAYAASHLSRNKTDKSDAILIAHFCAKENPAPWEPPSEGVEILQALIRRLQDLQNMRQQERNRLKSGVTAGLVIEGLQRHIDYLDQQIKALRKEIRDHIDRYPDLRQQRDLIVSIPGIAELTAARLLGEIKDIHSFESAPQLAAYAGLTPYQRTSGSSVRRKPRISKTGNANIRSSIYMPAIVAMKYNPIINSFCHRLEENGLIKMKIVVAAMRKLLHLVFGVLKSGIPFDPHYLDQKVIPS
jgi:transposase